MSTKRTLREERGRDLWKTEKGPGGRNLCRYCRNEVLKGRRTFCSESCIEEWRVRNSQSYARAATFKRDRGVCAQCHRDTEALRLEFERLKGEAFSQPYIMPYTWEPYQDFMAKLVAEGYTHHHLHTGIWWNMDHIVEVVNGGGTCGLENYQTLCVPCHKEKTKKLAKERAEARRAQKQSNQEPV